MHEGGAEYLAWLLAHVPDNQEAMLRATRDATHKTTHLERGIDARISKAACECKDCVCLWTLERVLELPALR